VSRSRFSSSRLPESPSSRQPARPTRGELAKAIQTQGRRRSGNLSFAELELSALRAVDDNHVIGVKVRAPPFPIVRQPHPSALLAFARSRRPAPRSLRTSTTVTRALQTSQQLLQGRHSDSSPVAKLGERRCREGDFGQRGQPLVQRSPHPAAGEHAAGAQGTLGATRCPARSCSRRRRGRR
jgi:hypothetical protein